MTATQQRWAEQLRSLALPEEILQAAPESPWFFDPALFSAAADAAVERAVDTPSDAAARDALPPGGIVLDVGAGAGAGSLPLSEKAGRVVAVDPSVELLARFAERAERLGVAFDLVQGPWPEVADRVPPADVVVCHHVVYNVPELSPFAVALAAAARRRVVVELTAEHPLSWMAPYWRVLHGHDQPSGPTADDAAAVFREAGYVVRRATARRPLRVLSEEGPQGIAPLARRLCLPGSRHDELRRLLVDIPPPVDREIATLWWETT